MLKQRRWLARWVISLLVFALLAPTAIHGQADDTSPVTTDEPQLFLPVVVRPQSVSDSEIAQAAASTLGAGDIAIIGYNADNPDEIAFVALNTIDAGTQIHFTDNGWKSDGTFRTGEGTFTWTAAITISPGTIVAPAVAGIALSASGDQVLVYQGAANTPTFIYALNNEDAGVWQADATSSNTSALPNGLANGSTAFALDEIDNAVFNGSGPFANCTALRIAAATQSNWSGSDAIRQTMPSGSYSITDTSDCGVPATDTPPTVTSTLPSNGATNVAVDTAITINFNESVNLTASAVTLECPAATTIAFTGLPANDVTSITLTPGANLPESTLCNATIVAAQVTDNDGAVDIMAADVAFSFTTATTSAGGNWVINEIQADPDAVLGDANGDGTVNTADDEFVEIVNNSGSPVDISGWTLADGNSVRHTFPAGTVVPDQCAMVVFGGGTPSGSFGGATVQTASNNTLGLNNGGDSVTLNNGATDVVTYGYGSEGDDNQSLTRSPDITGDDPLVKHTSVTAARFSPGTKLDGTAFAGCTPPVASLKIHEVQGAGTSVTSPNTLATVEAVVVGDYQADGRLGGFFLQEEDLDVDGNPSTSEGIFVYCGSCAVDVAVGDVVQVTGTQEERYGMSQLDATDAVGVVSVQSSGNALPSAASINLPLDAAAYEPFEGMLVTFPQELTVAEYFTLARYGQITLHQGGRIEQFTNANVPDASAYAAHLDDKARRTIILDDDNNIQNAPLNFIDSANDEAIYFPSPGGFSTMNFFRGGDTVTNLTGVLHWSFAGQTGTDAWRVRPVPEQFSYTFTPANPRPAVPNVGGNVQVASFNVLNYFNGDGAGGGFPTSRGADSPAEFARQTEKIVAAITALDADVIGLMEIENDYGTNANSAIASLTNALNVAAGTVIYGYVDPGSNVGTDEIAVGFVYRTTAVTPLGGPAILNSAAFLDPNSTGTDKNRPAIAQTFRVSDSANPGEGELFTVAVNHLKSKGSSCGAGDDDPDTGQGNCNDTRTKAAQTLTTWLAGDPTGSGDADALIIGDLNAYAKEDPITAITGAGYTDLIDFYSGGDAYSYLFDGETGYLDHALANPALAAQVTGAAHWHINADEVNVLDYNDTLQDSGELDFERKPTVNTLYESKRLPLVRP